MKEKIIFCLFVLITAFSAAQETDEELEQGTPTGKTDSDNKLERKFSGPREDQKEKPPITDYKIISIDADTTFVDTTLTIYKDYKYNYLRKDDFGLQPLNNVGQPYNSLIKQENFDHLLPLFGARARHFNYMEAGDINYYYVPTPLTELYFKTTFEQGQQLDAFFTVNPSPQLNLSIAYKGVRSLGKYKHALASTGNFRATANYKTKNDRYNLKTHFVSQDLLLEENGGLSEQGVQEYLFQGEFADDRDRFADRSTIEVNFENAESTLEGRRFYLDHNYTILKKTDSTDHYLAIGHHLDITDKSYEFSQSEPDDLFGESFVASNVSDEVALEDFTNDIYLDYTNKYLGEIQVSGGYTDFNYGYNTILIREDGQRIPNRIKGNTVSAGVKYQNEFKGFYLKAEGKTLLSGDFEGSRYQGDLEYNFNEFKLNLGYLRHSSAPNYNFLLYQSDYETYNWENDFENVEMDKISAQVQYKDFAAIEASYNTINNHTYFTKAFSETQDSVTLPRQFGSSINILKLQLKQQMKFWVFGIDNTIVYQTVSGNEDASNENASVYNVPEIVTRNSFYYEDHWFKKALYLQTGFTFKYYSSYEADGYDPVLGEFYVQSPEEIRYFDDPGTDQRLPTIQEFGGYPQFDIFFNAKIKQTRIFFKVENFGEAFIQNNEFSAPNYAPRDAVIRFGIVWNFFL